MPRQKHSIGDYAVCAAMGALLAWGLFCGLERQTEIEYGGKCARGEVAARYCPPKKNEVQVRVIHWRAPKKLAPHRAQGTGRVAGLKNAPGGDTFRQAIPPLFLL